MPEFLQEFLSWYLAPWRRIGRKTFGIALTVATVPALLLMFTGWGSSAGSFLGPVMSIANASQQMEAQNNDRSGNDGIADVQQRLEKFKDHSMAGMFGTLTGQGEATGGKGIDWTGIINGICLLLMVPISRMRLRDMGWYGWQENLLTVVFNISVLGGLIFSLTGWDILPMSDLWGMLNFGGYGWLSFAKSKPRAAVHEKVPDTWEPPAVPVAPRDPDLNPMAPPKKDYLNHDPD